MFEDSSDAELLERCRAGYQAAWSTLVRRYQRLVFTVPRRAGLSDAAAEDVFQATFVKLYENLARIDEASRIRSWLVTTARRCTLDALAVRDLEASRRAPDAAPGDDLVDAVEQVADPHPLPEQLLAELQELDRVRQAVEKLEPRLRQFVELVFLQDEAPSYAEISRRLGIPEGSIGPTRARCIEKLCVLLGVP